MEIKKLSKNWFLKKISILLVAGIAWGIILITIFLKNTDNSGNIYKELISNDNIPEDNAIYYWKTTFQLTEYEKQFLHAHNIHKIYMRMFDVDYGEDNDGTVRSIPVATTRFLDTIPAGIEIVPTVYITTKAIRKNSEFASLLYNRVQAMVKQNKLGNIKEIQVDCDWTKDSQSDFFSFCEELRNYAVEDGIKISATIRLHQLRKDVPPVDKGVLMLYNTGSVYSSDTKNSILSYKDVEPYLCTEVNYPLPLDYAFPAYEWSILFRGNQFHSILRTTDFRNTDHYKKWKDNKYEVIKATDLEKIRLWKRDIIYVETSSLEEILKVKKLVRSKIKQHSYHSIIYHLDGKNLSKYTQQEIDLIYKND